MIEKRHEEIDLKFGGTELGSVSIAGRIRKEGNPMKTFRHLGSYAVIQLLDGSGWYEDERGYRARLDAGDVIVVEPDVGHRYGPEAGGVWEEFYVVFAGEIFDLWREVGRLKSGLWKDRGDGLEEWGGELMTGVRETAKDGLVLLGFMQMMLAKLRKFDPEPGVAGDVEEWVTRAMRLLARSGLGLEEVAEEVGMRYEHFRKEFKKKVGISPNGFRQRQLATRGWHLLSGSNKTIKEVSELLGFCDAYYFSRFMKKHTKHSPREIRRGKLGRLG